MIFAVAICRVAIGAATAGRAGVAISAESELKKKRLFMHHRWPCASVVAIWES